MLPFLKHVDKLSLVLTSRSDKKGGYVARISIKSLFVVDQFVDFGYDLGYGGSSIFQVGIVSRCFYGSESTVDVGVKGRWIDGHIVKEHDGL